MGKCHGFPVEFPLKYDALMPVFLVVHPLESGKWAYNPVVESVEGITQEAGAFFFNAR